MCAKRVCVCAYNTYNTYLQAHLGSWRVCVPYEEEDRCTHQRTLTRKVRGEYVCPMRRRTDVLNRGLEEDTHAQIQIEHNTGNPQFVTRVTGPGPC